MLSTRQYCCSMKKEACPCIVWFCCQMLTMRYQRLRGYLDKAQMYSKSKALYKRNIWTLKVWMQQEKNDWLVDQHDNKHCCKKKKKWLKSPCCSSIFSVSVIITLINCWKYGTLILCYTAGEDFIKIQWQCWTFKLFFFFYDSKFGNNLKTLWTYQLFPFIR